MIFMYFGQLKYVTFFQRHFPVRRRSLWIPAEPHYPAPFVSLFYEAHCAASIMGLTPASACPALCPSPCVSSSAPTRLPLARSQVVPSSSCLGRRGCLAMPPTSSISAWVLQGVWSRRSWEGGFSCAPLCIPVGEENVGARLLSPLHTAMVLHAGIKSKTSSRRSVNSNLYFLSFSGRIRQPLSS